jgi:hypothetical protein
MTVLTKTKPESSLHQVVRQNDMIRLAASQLFSLNPQRAEVQVQVVYGKIWLTQANDAQDYLLEAGERMTLRKKSKALIQALDGAGIRVG